MLADVFQSCSHEAAFSLVWLWHIFFKNALEKSYQWPIVPMEIIQKYIHFYLDNLPLFKGIVHLKIKIQSLPPLMPMEAQLKFFSLQNTVAVSQEKGVAVMSLTAEWWLGFKQASGH